MDVTVKDPNTLVNYTKSKNDYRLKTLAKSALLKYIVIIVIASLFILIALNYLFPKIIFMKPG